MYSGLALATFARMVTGTSGALADPALAPLVHWAPIACWGIAGALLVGLTLTYAGHAFRGTSRA
jgi:hypothetical protein